MPPLDTTPEQILREAIQSEVAARAFLQALAERTATPEARKRMLSLADRELVHRAQLERRYREVVGSEPPATEPVRIEIPEDLVDLDLSRALKIVLERERESESSYRFLAERTSSRELKNLLLELAEVEWNHKIEIQNEYDASLADPDRFFLDF
jgi:rubrerythrin